MHTRALGNHHSPSPLRLWCVVLPPRHCVTLKRDRSEARFCILPHSRHYTLSLQIATTGAGFLGEAKQGTSVRRPSSSTTSSRALSKAARSQAAALATIASPRTLLLLVVLQMAAAASSVAAAAAAAAAVTASPSRPPSLSSSPPAAAFLHSKPLAPAAAFDRLRRGARRPWPFTPTPAAAALPPAAASRRRRSDLFSLHVTPFEDGKASSSSSPSSPLSPEVELLVLARSPSSKADEGTGEGGGGGDEDASAGLLDAEVAAEEEGSNSSAAAASPSPVIPRSLAYLLLNIVTVLWGTQHAVIKGSLLAAPGHPGVLNALRFAVAALCFLPWTPNVTRAEEREGIWRAGGELGVWMFLGYALQAVGLGSTTAARSGFLLYLNVKLVPLFAWALLGRKPTLDVWASALVAFLGTALLAFGDGGLHPPNAGDGWSLLAAAASAMFILRLEGAAQSYGASDARGLNAVTLWVTAALCLGWAGAELAATAPTPQGAMAAVAEVVREDWARVLYLSVVTTALCNWVQTLGQRVVPAEKAALIYALDPVYGAVFARLLLGEAEALGPVGYAGGALVTAAALFSTLYSAGKGTEGEGGDGAGVDGDKDLVLPPSPTTAVWEKREKGEI